MITVQNDGYSGVDRLVSIERIIATEHADTFKFNGQFDADLNLKIDAKGTASTAATGMIASMGNQGSTPSMVETVRTSSPTTAKSPGSSQT